MQYEEAYFSSRVSLSRGDSESKLTSGMADQRKHRVEQDATRLICDGPCWLVPPLQAPPVPRSG